jgi:hypothetical protein
MSSMPPCLCRDSGSVGAVHGAVDGPLLAHHAEETDPAWRVALADMIQSDAAFLSEMRETVMPQLPLVLPIGLPAPRAGWGVVL